ncbi:MAG TPA: 2-dehydropantoate 2-reductase [Bacillales bacterium]|nr:2-dehydropantoate 2-reductase [Bacillales bacterium]
MRIAVIGGGAVGLFIAAYAAKAAQSVTLYVRRSEQAKLLTDNGIKWACGDTEDVTRVTAVPIDQADVIEADFVIVAVKQYHLPSLKQTLCERVHLDVPLLFIQNGMGHVDFMRALPHRNVGVGVVEHGVLKRKDHEVIHCGAGRIKIASFHGSVEAAEVLADIDPESFPVCFVNDWYRLLAEKLVVNATINPLTAMHRVKNGKLLSNANHRKEMRRLFEEAVCALGLNEDDLLWEHVLEVCRNTAENRSSMLRDIESGTTTEIEAISGYLLKIACKKNIRLPFTEQVYLQIKRNA